MFDLQQGKAILTLDGLLMEDVCIYFRFFNQLHYSHFKKEGNKVVHGLAWYALYILDFIVWMENVLPPSFFFIFFCISGWFSQLLLINNFCGIFLKKNIFFLLIQIIIKIHIAIPGVGAYIWVGLILNLYKGKKALILASFFLLKLILVSW